jgi:predicted ATPase/class 3 adenylate cyclase
MAGGSLTQADSAARAPQSPVQSRLPAGLVTFVFTDIEGSTQLLHRLGRGYVELLDHHRALARAAADAHDGHVVSAQGDEVFLAFADAAAAVLAVRDLHLALASATWPDSVMVRIRAGAHSDEAIPRRDNYVALGVHQAARISAAAHGGQTLLSSTTAALARGRLPPDVALVDLGQFVIRDFPTPERLHQLLADGIPRTFPPPRTAGVTRHNLPVERSSLVGRDQELTTLREDVRRHRLVTVTGSGGVGKTRLAVEAAGGLLDDFPEGVWLTELAPVPDADGVAAAIAQTLGVPARTDGQTVETLLTALADRALLLVLDNCEHVVDATAELVDRLLTAPGVHVLATSQEPLGVYGETVRRVPSLSLAEAAELFRDRAAAVGPLNVDDSAVEAVCRHLDGIPLAVELAAACTASISVGDLANRLDDRFRLLQSGGRRALPRHRTLRALVDWSHDLLTDHERVLFRRLSVFAGGCTLEEAEHTCAGDQLPAAEVVTALTGLVDKSLVQVSPGVTGVGRYTLLETLRLYGTERLLEAEEAEEAQRHHLQAMATFARSAGKGIAGPEFDAWLRRCDEESDNVTAALGWQLSDDDARLARLQIVTGHADYWNVRGRATMVPAWERVIAESADSDPALRLTAAVGLAGLLTNEEEVGEVRQRLESLVGAEPGIGPSAPLSRGLSMLAWAYANEGRADEARSCVGRALTMAEAVDDGGARTLAYLFASSVHAALGDADAALIAARAGTEAAERAGITRLALNAAVDLGWAQLVRGDLDAAWAATAQALSGALAARSPGHECSARLNLGHIHRLRGETADAAREYADGLLAARASGAKRDMAEALEGLGVLAVGAGHPQPGVELFGAAARVRDTTYPMETALRPAFDEAVGAARAALGEAAVADLTARGRALSPTDLDALLTEMQPLMQGP